MISMSLLPTFRMPIYKPHNSQKDYIICGPELGVENIGQAALIHHALYSGKAAGRDFRNHLHSCMEFLNFKSCLTDPNVWMRPAIKSDGNTYYEYILLYVDNVLVVSENAESCYFTDLLPDFRRVKYGML